jgi:catechol 2,3-dioxygenase-like lactoylglutathione lyase family enzyme
VDLYLVTRRTTDMERALAFYVGVLGLERAHEIKDPRGRHVVYATAKGRAWAFQLVQDGGPAPVVDPGEYVSLESDSLETDLNAIRARGGTLDGPHALPGGARYAFLADPDGHRIRLIDRTGFLKHGVGPRPVS